MIRTAGIETQDAQALCVRPASKTSWSDSGSEIHIAPAPHFQVEVSVTFDDWLEGQATIGIALGADGEQSYAAKVAPARTFAFQWEVEALLAAGLAKGGSLDNALVITPPDTFSTPLRLPAEWAAHKLLDVIGDFALLDARPQFRLTIIRPGHRINTQAADRLGRESPVQSIYQGEHE